MPLSSRLQKKRLSNCPDLFSRAVTGLTGKNNSAEIDGYDMALQDCIPMT